MPKRSAGCSVTWIDSAGPPTRGTTMGRAASRRAGNDLGTGRRANAPRTRRRLATVSRKLAAHRKSQVGAGQTVINAMCAVLNPTRMHDQGGRGTSVEAGRRQNALRRHT